MEEELEGPMSVQAVSWIRSDEGGSQGDYQDVSIYMGLSSSDDLTPWFDQNYIAGTRELVFQSDALFLEGAAREWLTVTLDQPFDYPGTGNLIVEIRRGGPSKDAFLLVGRWSTGRYRTLMNTDPDGQEGIPARVAPMLRLDYLATHLSRVSWAGIKSLCLPR